MSLQLRPLVNPKHDIPQWEDSAVITRNEQILCTLTYEEVFRLRALIDDLNVKLVEALMRHG